MLNETWLEVATMHSNEPLGMPMGLKVFVAARFSVGSIFTGAHGLFVVSLLAAFGATITGITAVANAGKAAPNSAMLGIAAGTLSMLATAFALSAPITIPFGILALLAAIPAVMWFAFWVRNREFIQRS
ncbi:MULTISPECIES: hypothetical protein [unclassified Arthrobacter]|uniref:hypothetical protein n=1 Tax=unclassified Arthrobacter TaxID=235627 RepID=UPI0011B058E2|nr:MULTISPECIES: hypothetical protein [unclassified Arthrobacter]